MSDALSSILALSTCVCICNHYSRQKIVTARLYSLRKPGVPHMGYPNGVGW